MESLPLCLPLYSLSLFPCCLTLAFTLASVYVCVCVGRERERPLSEQQEYIITQTKGVGLLFMNYQPSKPTKAPIFIENSIFISAPFDYQSKEK